MIIKLKTTIRPADRRTTKTRNKITDASITKNMILIASTVSTREI